MLDHLPLLQHTIVIDDGCDEDLTGLGSVDFEDAMASGSPERDFAPRSADDRYILYTGGTTGMPKGVVWRHEDVFFALGGGIDILSNARVEKPEALVETALAAAGPSTMMPIAPLMHGATQWGVMGGVVPRQQGRAHGQVRRRRARSSSSSEEKVNQIMITGDAMARPMIDALEADGAELRPVVALLDRQHRGAVLAVGQGPLHGAAARTSCSATRSDRRKAARTATRSSRRATPR